MTNHEEIIKELQKLRSIGPNPAFARTSRNLILETQKQSFRGGVFGLFTFPRFIYAGATLVIFIVASYFLFVPPKPIVSAAFNPENLSNELSNLSINTELAEVTYQENANKAIASALTEIKNTDVKHLNEVLLESEKENINVEGSTNPQIDELLEAVISE